MSGLNQTMYTNSINAGRGLSYNLSRARPSKRIQLLLLPLAETLKQQILSCLMELGDLAGSAEVVGDHAIAELRIKSLVDAFSADDSVVTN